MFIHIGNSTSIKSDSIVLILDLDSGMDSRATSALMRRLEDEGRVVNCAPDLPKSLVLTSEDGVETAYLSMLRSATLKKRCRDPYARMVTANIRNAAGPADI